MLLRMKDTPEKISNVASKLHDDRHDIDRFAATFDADKGSAKAKHARSFFYQWLIYRRLRDALENPFFETAAAAVICQIWPIEVVRQKVALSEFIGNARELNHVWSQLVSDSLVTEPEIGIDPVTDPHRFIATREAQMAATSVQLLHLLPILSKTRFANFTEAWSSAAENGKVNPLSFGILVGTFLNLQIHGSDKAIGDWATRDIGPAVYVAEIVSRVFSEVDAALTS